MNFYKYLPLSFYLPHPKFSFHYRNTSSSNYNLSFKFFFASNMRPKASNLGTRWLVAEDVEFYGSWRVVSHNPAKGIDQLKDESRNDQ